MVIFSYLRLTFTMTVLSHLLQKSRSKQHFKSIYSFLVLCSNNICYIKRVNIGFRRKSKSNIYVITISERKMGFHSKSFSILCSLIEGLLTQCDSATIAISLYIRFCLFVLLLWTRFWRFVVVAVVFVFHLPFRRFDVFRYSLISAIHPLEMNLRSLKHLAFFFRFILLTYFNAQKMIFFPGSPMLHSCHTSKFICVFFFVQYRTKQTIRLFMLCALEVKIRVFFSNS